MSAKNGMLKARNDQDLWFSIHQKMGFKRTSPKKWVKQQTCELKTETSQQLGSRSSQGGMEKLLV